MSCQSIAANRLLDVLLSALGLVLVSPIMLLASLAVWATMGRPVLFRQVRPGLGGRPFTLYKLRTMREAVGRDGRPLPDAERLTRVGRVIRKLSIDELPQLWNVLRGDMSLVGPRPLLMEYLDRYTPEQARRHEVRPGITGWAQVHGRNDAPFSRRLELDVWYVDNRSLGLDLRILLVTVASVVGARGVRPGQEVAEVDDLGLSRPAPQGDDHDAAPS